MGNFCEAISHLFTSFLAFKGLHTEAVGKTRRGGGAALGDQWVKSGDWELGDHMVELCRFDSR